MEKQFTATPRGAAGSHSLADAVRAFLDQKKVDAGLSANSTSAYAIDLAQFVAHAGGLGVRLVADAGPATVETYLASRRESGAGPATLARKASSVRQFFRFAVLELGLEVNPAEDVRAAIPKRSLPKALGTDAVHALLRAVEEGLPYARHPAREALRARDRALLTLLYATGVRVTELVSLTLGQIDFDESLVRVHGKGSKERLVPFVPLARDRLDAYRGEHRRALLLGTEGTADARHSPADLTRPGAPFFLSDRGEPLTRQAFWKTLKALALRAGITDRLSPHWLRHTFATHLLEAGLNLRTLQLLLGHSDVATTQIYTEVSPAHLKEVHSKFHPRGGEE